MKFIPIAILFSVILVAGCTSQTQMPGYPTFTIRSPAQGQVISGNTANLILDNVQNVILVTPNGSAVPGQGVFHFFLDNANEVVTPRLTHTFDVAPGEHTIRIELRRGDNTSYNPAIIKSVSFTVAGQVPPANTTTNTSSTNTNGTVCAQVITPAYKDGQCTEYPTPCDVPAGWQKVNSCTARQFNVTASNWKFEPSTLTVNKDDLVTIRATSADGAHGLNVPYYNVDLQLSQGTWESATFVANKTGTYTFYCDIYCGAGHNDMKGSFVVNP